MTDTQAAPFRTAQTSVDVAPPSTTSSQTAPTERVSTPSDGPTPFVYEAIKKQPYAVKHLGLDLYDNDPNFPEVREQAKALDEYVIKQAKARGLTDDEKSYKEVIDAIYKQIGRSSNEDPTQALKRLSIAAGALERLNRAKLPPVLSAASMEPEEFEGVIADATI